MFEQLMSAVTMEEFICLQSFFLHKAKDAGNADFKSNTFNFTASHQALYYRRPSKKKLLQFAEQLIEVRSVYMDREYFSGAIINLMNDNWTYIMPAVHTSRIQEKIQAAEGETFQRYTTRVKESSTFILVLREDIDGELKAFATNCRKLEIPTYNLFNLYGQRRDIDRPQSPEKQIPNKNQFKEL
jgi:hypothetical protein